MKGSFFMLSVRVLLLVNVFQKCSGFGLPAREIVESKSC